MKTPIRTLCTTLLALSFLSLSRADSLLVSCASTDGGGGIEQFSLTPQAAGTLFDPENAAITSVTVANHTVYWASTQVCSDSVTDTTAGVGKTPLPSVPFASVSITDLAVDPVIQSSLVPWNALSVDTRLEWHDLRVCQQHY